jgi:large subunit ribosomal protein L7/L12
MPGVEEMITTIEKMTVLELNDLVKALETKFGVIAAPVAAAQGAAAGAAKEEEAADEHTVTLAATGDKKIQVLKLVREVTGLGLKEAKDLVDGAPKVLKEKVTMKEAKEIKAKIEAEGAKVEVK